MIQDKKLMSQILEIDGTEGGRLIVIAFLKQYGELWIPQEERTEKLWSCLQERILTVLSEQKAMNGENGIAWESWDTIESGVQQMKLF